LDIEDEIGGDIKNNLNSDPLEGGIDGVDNLDTSLSSVDTGLGGDVTQTDNLGGDMSGDMTGMAGDPNALSAGGNPEVQQFVQDFQNSDPETQNSTMKYFDSQKKDGGTDQPADAAMPPSPGAMPESKFNFKRIIDETFSAIFGDGNQSNFERGTTDRPQTVVGEDALTQLDNPYLPR
jgi:hypothetical protein